MADISNEPSMDEILSSIKRIIAEDSEAAVSPPRKLRAVSATRTSAEEPEVLELTQTVDDSPSQPATPVVPAAPEKAPLVSETTVEASRASLAALSALVVKPDVYGTDTLEGLVREMLKPMVAQWLEARLPEIVERMVAQEIRRITERA